MHIFNVKLDIIICPQRYLNILENAMASSLSFSLKPQSLSNKRISTLFLLNLLNSNALAGTVSLGTQKEKSLRFNFFPLFVHLYKCLQIISSSNLTSLSVYWRTFFVWNNCHCLSKDLISLLPFRTQPETRINSAMHAWPGSDSLICHLLILLIQRLPSNVCLF